MVPKTVAAAPTPKAAKTVPVSRKTRFKSESNNKSGTANGIKKLLTMASCRRENEGRDGVGHGEQFGKKQVYNAVHVQTGDTNGKSPRFATIKASAMVAKGADSALPMVVLRSSDIPKVESHKTKVKT